MKKLQGLRAYKKGKTAEAIFQERCLIEKIPCIKIHEGATITKTNYFRTKQICDFIISIEHDFYLIDVKSKDKLTRSFFFPKRPCSTSRQTSSFINLAKSGNLKTGFVNISQGKMYFIPASSLVEALKTKKVFYHEIDKVQDIKKLC